MSREFIEKEAALEFLKYLDREHGNKHFIWGVETYAEYLQGLPPADVKPVVRGENIATDYAEFDQFICSECGIHLQDWVRIDEDDYEDGIVHEYVFNFCPNCGAEMRKEENDVSK